jgi:hypothetical protein
VNRFQVKEWQWVCQAGIHLSFIEQPGFLISICLMEKHISIIGETALAMAGAAF